MQRTEFGYETTVTDLQALQTFMTRRIFAQNRRHYGIALAGVVLCALFLTAVIVINASPPRLSGPNTYLALIALLLLGAVLALIPITRLRLRTLRMQISAGGPLVGATRMTVSADGLTIERKFMRTTYAWPAFKAATIEKNAVILIVDNGMGVIIPPTAFQTDAERFEFAAEASKRLSEAKVS